MIGRLFVKPVRHDYGIARYLLKESVKLIETRGRVPVMSPDDLAFVPPALCAKLRFHKLRTGDGVLGALIRTE